MKSSMQEVLGVLGTLVMLAGVPLALWAYERSRDESAGVRVIRLSGVMKDGVWTDEEVTAATYWRKTYRPATVVLRAGEEVLLRLSSADVTHGFYVPELGAGPVEVEPGHVVEVRLKGERPGEYTYYCTAVCGECHHFMRGTVIVLNPDGSRPEKQPRPTQCAHRQPSGEDRTGIPIVERGRHLFENAGCVGCHGPGGRGGVPNPNYIRDTVPALDVLAERMMLFEREDADKVVDLLAKRTDPTLLADRPPFPRYAGFLAQYNAVLDVIRKGSAAAKKDPAGPIPPLQMPTWGQQLSREDIDAVIAYLISEFRWEEEASE